MRTFPRPTVSGGAERRWLCIPVGEARNVQPVEWIPGRWSVLTCSVCVRASGAWEDRRVETRAYVGCTCAAKRAWRGAVRASRVTPACV
jgi:hypothetical protein